MNIELQKKISLLSKELCLLAPWNFMNETDLFGIKTSVTDTAYFISIMGAGGEIFAVSAYKGEDALDKFWEIINTPYDQPERILTIPHFMLSFNFIDGKTDLKKPETYQALSIKTTIPGVLSDLVEIVPGYLPVAPADSGLADCSEILEQTLDVCLRAAHDKYFINPEENEDDVYLVREPVSHNGTLQWNDRYRKISPVSRTYKISIQKPDLDALVNLPESRTVLQVGFRMLPNPIQDHSSPAYFPFILILVNKTKDFIEGFELLSPIPDYDSMLSGIVQKVARMLLKSGFKPRCIEVKNLLVFDMLKLMLSRAGIRVISVKTLKPCQDILESYMVNI